MKVLLLPVNVASDLSHKVRALKSIGVDARGLCYGSSITQTAHEIKVVSASNGIARYLNKISFLKYMYEWIEWADVLHWFWNFNTIKFKLDKKITQWLDKPGVVQWSGSDIRIPSFDYEINPYFKTAFENGYEYPQESYENSMSNQNDFADVGFYPLEFIGMGHYIDQRLFPKRFRIWQSVVLNEHEPRFPDRNKQRPLVLHSPSAPVAKGTQYVLQAVDKLKTICNFDFKLVQGMPREEALQITKECDIYIDQMIGGGHGAAAVEAMAFGKPVVCYINPIIGKDYPADLPIVNANADNLAEKLEPLIRDASLRHEIGKKSRVYVEKYHDDKKIAGELLRIYEEVIDLHKQRKST